jgi:hypothetical protein
METVLFEPDQQQVLAILPAALWLSPGDVVDLDDRGTGARVLSSRLQVSGDIARVLVFLDVPDEPAVAVTEEVPAEVVEHIGQWLVSHAAGTS